MTSRDDFVTMGHMSYWRKSSHSFANGNCVEAATWRKSSHSGYNNSCVEAGDGPGAVLIRDTQHREGPVLEVTPAAWREFTERLRGGRP